MHKNTLAASLKIRIAVVVATAAAVAAFVVHSGTSTQDTGTAPVATGSIGEISDAPDGNFPWG